jgi:hypothetical protein
MTTTQSTSGDPQHQDIQGLERRLLAVEQQVQTLAVALDAASRLRIRTPLRLQEDIRIAGGKRVRRILEQGGLIHGYPEVPGAE